MQKSNIKMKKHNSKFKNELKKINHRGFREIIVVKKEKNTEGTEKNKSKIREMAANEHG